jgi:uracil-DNA glycosylase family 4
MKDLLDGLDARLLADHHLKRLLRPSGGCKNCPRRRVDFVPATLSTADSLWIGEAPGAIEVDTGRGFTGKSGQFMRDHAAKVHIPEFAVSNIVKCRPPDNATPKPKEIACCLAQFTLDEIPQYPLIVLVGSVALNALFPKALATHYRGNLAYHPDFPNQRFYNIYHPAYIIGRRRDLEGEFAKQIERLSRILREPKDKVPWKVLAGSDKKAQQALAKILQAPLISLDAETTSLESWKPGEYIRSFAVTADEKTVVFTHHEDKHWDVMVRQIRSYLEESSKSVVGSHVAFDIDWFERELDFSAACTGIYDLGNLWYQARQYRMPSLKELVSRELDGYRYLVYDPATETNIHLLGNYNAEDVIYSLQLFHKGIHAINPKTRDLVTRVLGPVTHCFRQMTTTGLYMRLDYLEQKIEEYQERRKATITAWHEEDRHFIPKTHESGKGLHKHLFEIHKLPILETTKTGEPVVDQHVIRRWITEYGAKQLQHLLDMREVDKILSTYLIGQGKLVDKNSRVHSDYVLTLTPTGRSTSRDPNVQNIPRLPEIRDLYGVPPSAALIEADLNQIEFRIMV